MPITVPCSCGLMVQAPDSAAGSRGRCPGCGADIAIPAAVPGPGDGPAPPVAEPARPGPRRRYIALRLASAGLFFVALGQFALACVYYRDGSINLMEWSVSLAVLMIGFFGVAILAVTIDVARRVE